MIWDFFKQLFCKHEWSFLNYKDTYDYNDNIPTKTEKIYQCHKCLGIKKVKL